MDYRQMLVHEDISLREAMNVLDKTAQKILFVVDEHKRLLACITDGDIRRHLLRNGSMEAKAKTFANYHPLSIGLDQLDSAKEFMRSKDIIAVPVLREDGTVEMIVQNDSFATLRPHLSENVPVVINAGGKGTRLYPYTRILPKPLIPIGDDPIIELIINRFREVGCDQFYMIVNHKRNMIKAYFSEQKYDYHLEFVDEVDPLGTGGGLSLLKGSISSTFFFINCDTIIDDNLCDIYKEHKRNGNLITMICALKDYVVPYGVVETTEKGEIAALREKPHLSFFTNTGCYIVEPEVLEHMKQGENIDFPSLIERERLNGGRVSMYPISEKAWLDMGQFDAMERMKERLGIHD